VQEIDMASSTVPQPPASTATVPPDGTGSTDAAAERLVQGAHAAVDRVAEKAMPAVARARAGIDEAAGALRERRRQLGDMQAELTADAREQVRAHPLTSLVAAFAAGLVVARLLR